MLLESPSGTRTRRPYPPEDADLRRGLVKRIVASPSFAKSNRLSDFLRHVYALAERGRLDDINEQDIGSAVFGRTQDYDPAVDSIVRSHASRLRNKLKEYFEQEGKSETLVLTIPRGSYVPAFETRTEWNDTSEAATVRSTPDAREQEVPAVEANALADKLLALHASTESPMVTPGSAVEAGRILRRTQIALAVAVALIVLLAALLAVRSPLTSRMQAEEATDRNPLWRQFLADPATKTVLVNSDSGLVMFQHLTGRGVSLQSYISGDYLKDTSSPTVSSEIVRKLSTRRYTPALDLNVLDRLTRLFGSKRERLSSHYARDLRIEDLKQGNAVLLGTAESNPWVQLFEPSLNFHFQDDLLQDRARIVNRRPLPGEAANYDSTPQDAAPTIYSIVAYRPNLQASGHVLLLEGQTMAGTQTAADFVFDESRLLPFLKSIARPNGSVPYFELLLRSSSFGGQSSHIDLVAWRVEKE